MPSAAAQDAGTSYTVLGHDDEGFYFTVEGMEGRNPELPLEPGKTYTFVFRNVGTTFHNLHFGEPVGVETEILEPEKEETLNFTIPENASGTLHYWCDPHREQGMAGTADLGEAPVTQDTPGFTVLVAFAALGAAFLVARRR